MSENKGFALITGASKGIGKEMARQLAAQGWSLLLVARSADILQKLQIDLSQQYKVRVEIFAADLSEASIPAQIFAFCQAQQISVQILINNAGFGVWDKFEKADLQALEDMNNLNIAALIRMCHVFIPMLRQHSKAYLLNVASLGAFQPIPYMALYGAGKAYIRAFTFALRDELRESGISVTCLSPGGVDTDFPDRAGSHVVVERNRGMVMSAKECVRKTLKAMFKRRAEVIPGWYNVLAVAAVRFLPATWTAAMARKIMLKPD
jgi:uncharacterized protein